MADKKITALTDLGATAKDSAVDLLHIIDYSASPVNKKISVANLFSNANTDTHIYGASKTFEVGFAAASGATTATSAIKITSGANNSADQNVTINADGNAYTDFTVNSLTGSAIKVDAGTDDVTINADSIAAVDFSVNGDNGVNIYSDGGLDCVGIGTGTVDGTTTLTVAADATTGHAISTAGNINMSGVQALTVAAGNNVASLTVPVTRVSVPASGACVVTLADGVAGQLKIITTVAKASGSGTCTVDATNLVTATAPVISDVGDTVVLWYDTGSSKWMIISTVTTGNIGA
jgi:hypothetical protein